MSTRDIFLAFIFTIFGVFVSEHFSVGIILVLALIITTVFWKTRSKTIIFSIIAGLILGGGAALVHGNVPLEFETSKISGIVVIESGKQNAFGFQYTANATVGNDSFKIILETNDSTELSMGDRAAFSGTLAEPENFMSDYGKTFDYKNYLRAKGILYVVKNAKLTNIQKQSGFSLFKILDNIKNKFESSLEKALHEPASSLAEGMLVGDKGAMTKSDMDSFRKSGLIHMIVLSGYNISIVSAFILALLYKVPRRIALTIAIVAVALFVIMTGATATAVRAGVMGGLIIAGNFVHRKLDILRLLSITGILMTVFSPLSALYDPSFQLSFLATFGLISFGPWSARKLSFITEKAGLKEIVSATIGSQIMTLPYLAYSVGAVSVVSLFANVLVLPFAPFLMLFGFLTGIIYFIPFIYLPFAFVTTIISKYVFAVSGFFSNLPFSMFSTSVINGWMVAVLYIPLCFIGYKFYQEEKLRERK
ncbi:MAG: ComEC/Rec2 family competence protein [Minisyncoccia bacterium]